MKVKKIEIMHFLVPICLGLVILSYLFRSNNGLQIQVLFLTSILYVLVSLLHHYLDKTLSLEIIIEYVLIAGLSLIILTGSII